MADDYITLPIRQDPADFIDLGTEVFQGYVPEWDPTVSSPTTWIMEADANMAAQVAEVASTTATNLYIDSGQRLDGIPIIAAVAATGVVAITMQDTAGYDIPAGSGFGIDIGGGELAVFETAEDETVPFGSATLAGVGVTARVSGSTYSGLSGTAIVVDGPQEITGVTFTEDTADGQDGETTDQYLNRLTRLRRLRTDHPVIAEDFPPYLTGNMPAVERAAVLDGYSPVDVPARSYTVNGYDPANMATWLGRALAITPVDAEGEALGSTDFTAADVLFNGDPATGTPGHRESNFAVYVLNPHYTTISVTASLVVYSGWNPSDVEASAATALSVYLDPSRWGAPTSGEEVVWDNAPTLRDSDLYAVLKQVEGVKAVTSLSFGYGFTDNFSANTIASGLWTYGEGSGTLSITGGHIVPTSTTPKRIRRATLFGDNVGGWKFTTGASVAGGSWSQVIRELADGSYLRVRQDSASGQLTIRKNDPGDSALGSATTSTLATGTSYWLRGQIVGNVVTGQLWTTDPALGGSPSKTVTYTLTGADATKFGAGRYGTVGIRALPQATDEVYDDFTVANIASGGAVALPTSASEPIPLTRPGTMTVTAS